MKSRPWGENSAGRFVFICSALSGASSEVALDILLYASTVRTVRPL